jgi:hypothetical protein
MIPDCPEQHMPEVIYFDEWHVSIPAEVCRGCSDYAAGYWGVPASFCPLAKAAMGPWPCEREYR